MKNIIWVFIFIVPIHCYVKNDDFILQQKNVCFGAKHNRFGPFTVQTTGIMTRVKLVHTKGKVTCRGGSRGYSNWGCDTNKILTIVTGVNNEIMFPEKVHYGGSYQLPGYSPNSQVLILDNRNNNPYVEKGQSLRLWYGEDLKNHYSSDNDGETCADVYAVIRPVKFHLQHKDICFGAKGSSYGEFKIKQGGILTDLKLVHKTGQVRCTWGSAGKSNWGCGSKSVFVVLTETDKKIVFPKDVIHYKLPLYDSKSKEIILGNPTYNPLVRNGQRLQLWYGEDLKNSWEFDNSGTSCADVYAAIRPVHFKLQQKKVCFGAKGASFGQFTMKSNGILRSIKLVHTMGYVACSGRSSGMSHWGCGGDSLSILLTGTDDKVIYPEKYNHRSGEYTLPGYTSRSNDIVLNNPNNNPIVSEGEKFRLWYGEDLKDYYESDNSGKSCVDIYADIYQEYSPRCTGEDNGCCTAATPCKKGEGDCDIDSDCEAGLKCGTNNCPWGDDDDCCT